MFVGQHHGGPRNSQLAGKLACRGQTHSAFQLPVENPSAQLLMELVVERLKAGSLLDTEVLMRKIVVSEFVSLDNVMQAPGGAEEDTESGFTHGGWTGAYRHNDIGAQFFVGIG